MMPNTLPDFSRPHFLHLLCKRRQASPSARSCLFKSIDCNGGVEVMRVATITVSHTPLSIISCSLHSTVRWADFRPPKGVSIPQYRTRRQAPCPDIAGENALACAEPMLPMPTMLTFTVSLIKLPSFCYSMVFKISRSASKPHQRFVRVFIYALVQNGVLALQVLQAAEIGKCGSSVSMHGLPVSVSAFKMLGTEPSPSPAGTTLPSLNSAS